MPAKPPKFPVPPAPLMLVVAPAPPKAKSSPIPFPPFSTLPSAEAPLPEGSSLMNDWPPPPPPPATAIRLPRVRPPEQVPPHDTVRRSVAPPPPPPKSPPDPPPLLPPSSKSAAPPTSTYTVLPGVTVRVAAVVAPVPPEPRSPSNSGLCAGRPDQRHVDARYPVGHDECLLGPGVRRVGLALRRARAGTRGERDGAMRSAAANAAATVTMRRREPARRVTRSASWWSSGRDGADVMVRSRRRGSMTGAAHV